MNSPHRVIAVTGATGFVGQSLLAEAARQGTHIRALTRREQKPRTGVEWVPGDLANRAALDRLVRGADAMIHVAGVVNAPDPAGFDAANVAGTLNVVEATVAAGTPRFIHVSSLTAREPQLSTYGASKRRGEKIVAASGLDWTVVRPPAVYGPYDTEIFDLFRTAKWGVVPMPQTGRSSMIHSADLARLLLALVPSDEDVTSRVFEPEDSSPDGWLHRDLALAIGEAVGRKVFVPQFSKDTLLRFAALDRALRGTKAKLTIDRVNYMTHADWVCSKAKAPPAARWRPQIETRAGLRATAEWYRAAGWL